MTAPKTVSILDVAAMLGVSRMTIHRMRKGGELPESISMSRRLVRWHAADIELWFSLDCPTEIEFAALKQTRQQFARSRNRSR